MNKRVYNSTVGKIFRTLGFLLVLVSSLYISTFLVIQNSTLPFVGSILPFAEIIDSIITALPAFIGDYVGLLLIVGLLCIIWAIRKGVVLRVLVTVLLVFGYFESAINNSSSLAPIELAHPSFIVSILDLVEPFYNQIISLSEYVVPGVMLATPIFLWAIFANKKPGRFSILMFRLGSTTLFLAILTLVVGDLFVQSLASQSWYLAVQTSLYMVTYLVLLVGSAFGVIGFSRK